MQNKLHNIIDDAWTMDSSLLGGAEHTMRIGLITNTVLNSIPVVIPAISELMKDIPEDFKVDFKNLSELNKPVLLHFNSADIQLAVLVVVDKDSGHLQCYPFGNLNPDNKWVAYEMAFDMVPGGFVEVRPVHPLVEEFDPTKGMMSHLEALAIICSAFVYKYQNGLITLVPSTKDYSRINKKRVKAGKAHIVNNWNIEYEQETGLRDRPEDEESNR